ncbi:Uncharacterized protein TPAR_05321 [Tolypocladium paradoxum]|uniref:Uncharacterized protein n=1 Tax=Tolypocladium paradoxum TaxID=94208 RepID=A0A2S4KWA6_9HYPO|nr:Uncharacterized protein TPAR_05321 [Tolypocladium paradoxum]
MPSNKDRLYVALFARAGKSKMPGLEDTYHWGLLVGPKAEPKEGGEGTRFHAKQRMTVAEGSAVPQSVWLYEESPFPLRATNMLLLRVVVGKIKDMERLQSIFQRIPLRPDVPGWNCIEWAKEAFETALRDGQALGTSASDWGSVRDTAMRYAGEKKSAHRFDGKGDFDISKPPTWDMLDGRELIP